MACAGLCSAGLKPPPAASAKWTIVPLLVAPKQWMGLCRCARLFSSTLAPVSATRGGPGYSAVHLTRRWEFVYRLAFFLLPPFVRSFLRSYISVPRQVLPPYSAEMRRFFAEDRRTVCVPSGLVRLRRLLMILWKSMALPSFL